MALEGAETHGTWRKKGGEWWIFNFPKIDTDREIDIIELIGQTWD